MEKEVKFERALTVKSLAWSLGLLIFFIIYIDIGSYLVCNTVVRGFMPFAIWPTGNLGYAWPWTGRSPSRYFLLPAFFMIFIPSLTALLPKKLRLNAKELAFVYGMTAPMPMLASDIRGVARYTRLTYRGLTNPTWSEMVSKYVSPLLGPKDMNVLRAMETRWTPVPWDAWLIPITYYIIFYVAFNYFLLFGATLLRKQYIDVEDLAFPVSTAVGNYINMTEGNSKRPEVFRNKLLWLGVAVSFLTAFWFNLGTMIPGQSYYAFEFDLVPYGIYNGILAGTFEPWAFGLALMVPLEVTIAQPIWYIIFFIILPPILVFMGQLNPITPGSGSAWDYHNVYYTSFHLAPFTWMKCGWVPFIFGAGMALGIWPIISHREYWVRSIKTALSGRKEPDEPISQRYAWICWIISALVVIVMWILINIPVQYAILLIATVGVWYLGITRLRSETGGHLGGWGEGTYDHILSFVPGLSYVEGVGGNPAVAVPFVIFQEGMLVADYNGQGINVQPIHLETYKIGKMTNAKYSDLFKAQIIGVTLATIISVPLVVWICYTFGVIGAATHPALAELTYTYNVAMLNIPHTNAAFAPSEWYGIGWILGFATVAFMYVVRARLPRLGYILSPAGLMMAHTFGLHLWIPYAAAAVTRIIVYKVGGLDMYSKKILPFAIGLILGYAIYWFVNASYFIYRALILWGLI